MATDVKLSPTVQAARERREAEDQRAALQRSTAADLARVAFDAPEGFEPTAQDVQDIKHALARCYARHNQRQTVKAAQSAGEAPPRRRFSSIVSRF